MGLRSILIDVVDIWRPTVSVATSGAATADYKCIAKGARLRVIDRGSNERLVQGKEDTVSTHLLMCDKGLDLQADDDVRVRVRNTEFVFRVNTIDDKYRVKRLHHQEAMVTLISNTGFSR